MQSRLKITVIILLWPAYSLAGLPVFIGVLDQAQKCEGNNNISARILFYKEGNKWASIGVDALSKPSTNWDIKPILWTVVYNGKNIGNVKIEEPKENIKYINDWYYHRDKIHPLSKEYNPLLIENKSGAFSGWCMTPKYRPLTIVSKPNYEDKEMWKKFNPQSDYKKLLFPFLKVSVGKINLMRCEGGPDSQPSPYNFDSNETEIYDSYKSNNNKKLVSIGIDHKAINCEDPLSPEWSDYWYLVNGNNIDYVGSEMELVSAGDFDKDGKTEFLFWHSGYNEDGYILYYNDFKERVEYLWGYH